VVSSHFNDLQIVPYNEFLNKPYIKAVKVRQFAVAPPNLLRNTHEFVKELRKLKEPASEGGVNSSLFSDDVDRQKSRSVDWVNKLLYNKNIMPTYLSAIGVINKDPITASDWISSKLQAEDIDTE
jgi:hypothetical protein